MAEVKFIGPLERMSAGTLPPFFIKNNRKLHFGTAVALKFTATSLAFVALPLLAQSQLTDPDAAQVGQSVPTLEYDPAAIKAAADAQTAVYNSQKAAADAQKSMVEAQVAAEKAKFGSITGQTSITGAVSEGAEPGKAEALLLSTRANAAAARDVGSRVSAALEQGYSSKDILILTDISQLSNSDAVQYDFQRAALYSTLSAVGDECEAALRDVALPSSKPPKGGERFLPALGAGIDAAVKLGSYFQSDYKFGSVAITDPVNLTAATISAALHEKKNGLHIVVPNLVYASDANPIINDLKPVREAYVRLVGLVNAVHARAGAIRSTAPNDALQLDAIEARATKSITSYESFVSALTTPVAAADKSAAPSEIPAVRIMRQKLIISKLQSSLILLITSEKAGAYYTKKNLWTFFGGPPLFTMGGVSMVYMLIDPATNNVLASGAIPKHGGYRSVGAVERLFAK